jgi:outer membrane protein OmpA-like peptidoglycan-associated protein
MLVSCAICACEATPMATAPEPAVAVARAEPPAAEPVAASIGPEPTNGAEPDRDGDGIEEALDKCPADPEDLDGFEDADGCPDMDNDADGVLDDKDLCPTSPEYVDGFQDDDGCPEGPPRPVGIVGASAALALLGATSIELKQPLAFETGRATLRAESHIVLNAVADILVHNPLLRISIEGHTDGSGAHEHNTKMSRARAETVRSYLVGAGIAASRMTAVGYGETKPIASNATEQGRAANRRIELQIVR